HIIALPQKGQCAPAAKGNQVSQYIFVIGTVELCIEKIVKCKLRTMCKNGAVLWKEIRGNGRIEFDKVGTRHITCFGSVVFTYIFILAVNKPLAAAVLQVGSVCNVVAA